MLILGNKRLVWLDLETTGKNPATARIVQIGLKVLRPDGTFDKYEQMVNPLMPIPAEAIEKHHITDLMVSEMPPFSSLAPKMAQGLANTDVIAGFNVRYDCRVMSEELARCGFQWTAKLKIDPFRLWQIIEPRTLEDAVARWLGETQRMRPRHSALADALDAEEVCDAQLASRPDLPRNVDELALLCFPPDPNRIDEAGKFSWIDGVACLNFGKHRGTPVSDRAVRGYIEWMCKPQQDFESDTKRICGMILAGIDLVKPEPAAEEGEIE